VDKVMVGVTEYEEGMEVKLTYENDRPVILAMNEAGHCCTRVDLIQVLEWARDNMPELQRREWAGLTDDEISQIGNDVGYGYIDVARYVEAKLKEKNK